jgi:hypothetical protein
MDYGWLHQYKAQIGWWAEQAHNLVQLENTDDYVLRLAGRQVEGTWEYAVVRWRYLVPRCLATYTEHTLPQKYRALLSRGEE